MSVLSIRNHIEYAVLGTAVAGGLIWLAYHMLQTEGPRAGGAATIVALLALAVFKISIFATPDISLHTWWQRRSQPATIGEHHGQAVWERVLANHYIEVFDRTGTLIGERVYDFDFGEYPSNHVGAYELTYRPISRSMVRYLPLLARLRSPKLPVGPVAEVITDDNTVVGHTTYTVS